MFTNSDFKTKFYLTLKGGTAATTSQLYASPERIILGNPVLNVKNLLTLIVTRKQISIDEASFGF